MQKSRRPGGARAGGFPGEAEIFRELRDGPARHRVGLLPEGRAPKLRWRGLHPKSGRCVSWTFAPSSS
jgi:aminomethyltransferase